MHLSSAEEIAARRWFRSTVSLTRSSSGSHPDHRGGSIRMGLVLNVMDNHGTQALRSKPCEFMQATLAR